MVDFQKDLNLEQQRVVFEGNGPCLVLAGAGSGKTRTITYRVAYLLEQGVCPENILLVTFTNKAAKEMIERVEKLLPKFPPVCRQAGYPPFIKGGENGTSATPPEPLPTALRRGPAVAVIGKRGIILPWSGTFHHIAYKILCQYAYLLGYKNNSAQHQTSGASSGAGFTILDSQDSLDLLKLCLKQEGIDRKEKRFPSPKVLQAIISYARNAETTIEDTLDLLHPNFLAIGDVIKRIAEDYQKRKLEANVMDFDDLLVNLYLLLVKSPKIKDKFSQQFKYILVDEYQDTNKIQASIIDLLASKHQNLLVVGDDAQSIYSFRAADIQNILAFEKKYKNAKIFKLETNYRSTPDILNLANNIIANNLNQYKKNLSSLQEKFIKPEVHPFADNLEEAQFITDRVLELRDEGVAMNKMSVLFRAAYHSQALEMELTKRDIPYDYRGGLRFFERAHIKDVLSYLKIVNNLADAMAWSRVLNMQVGIGPVSAERIIMEVRDLDNIEDLANLGSHLSARGQMGWNDFLQIYEKLISLPLQGGGEEGVLERTDHTPALPAGRLPSTHRRGKPSDLIAEILDSKYVEYLENEYPDYRERLQDLEQLALYAERQPDLNQFLAEASLHESYNAKKVQDNEYNKEEMLILSTIHQAKGLEWDAVFVINLAQGQFPIERVRSSHEIEEERRLFYVAVTRAKKYLHLTYPLMGGFGGYLQGPSMFLDEIDKKLIDLNTIGGGTVFSDPSDDEDDVEYVREEGTSFLKEIDKL